ncbi:hypothetical protein [Phaeovulum vinaykumarii]|uniref:hypothetical protein n=1 Tax=Phaeovulum vinaykumarii TaxID=407234 RepID=UPI0009711D8D|nr:hypothetical protein [Phaeovulum vinaykumarii]
MAEEDDLAAGRTNADGSCKGGFYPRNPRADDRTCVPASAATKARREDASSWEHRLSSEVRGPNACKDGYTARLATDNDWVCVTRDRRRAVMEENRLADSRTDRSGEFPTCKQGFTNRLATLFDRTCVPPDARDKAARENRDARSHMRFPPS